MKYNSELISTICKYFETSKKECVEYIEMMNKDELKSILGSKFLFSTFFLKATLCVDSFMK